MSALDRLYQTMAVVSAGLRPLNPRPDISTLYVITAGLAGEVGEVMELLKKHIRDNIRIANRFDLTFDEVVEAVGSGEDR